MTPFVYVVLVRFRYTTLSLSERSAQIRYTILNIISCRLSMLFNMNQKYLLLVPSRLSHPQIARGISQMGTFPFYAYSLTTQLYTRCQNSHLYLQLSPLMENDRHPIELLC